MDKFEASNGFTVRAESRITGDRRIVFEAGEVAGVVEMTGAQMKALIETLDAERDEELGRWRYPEDHEWIVYPDGEDQLGNRHVITFWEKNGRRDSVYEDAIPGTVWGIVARAYFEAHPERKPWEDAKHGEVWLIAVGGDAELPMVVDRETTSFPRFMEPIGAMSYGPQAGITAARRIYPEVSDADR